MGYDEFERGDYVNNQEFGKFISTLRREKGITQIELAEKINVSDKAISRWENGKNYPDIEMLESLGAELGVSISELIACKRLDSQEQAELETARLYLGELKKKQKLISLIKEFLIVLMTIVEEFAVSHLVLLAVNNIFDSINDHQFYIPEDRFYTAYFVALTVASLILSVGNFGIILPRITRHNETNAKNMFFALFFVFLIIGVLQIILISRIGLGTLCFGMNALNTYALMLFPLEVSTLGKWCAFAVLFIIGCLTKPACYLIGSKIVNK